jgi:hypothetical protein
MAFSQTTISTGSIIGTVSDQSGALIPGAKVSIVNKATGQQHKVASNSAGLYNSGPLTPADYTVRVEAVGFATAEINLTVQVNNAANGNVSLHVGSTTTVVEVAAAGIQVNTDQATVQGVLTASQIETLPVNGRNFLDLAQLEPGVQIQEGSTIDPTKNGFSSISFEGRFGRTARIELDGVDISDETVGTTTQNVPASAIEEFQLAQSNLDMSTELTSSGAVSVTTRSGSNDVHGQGFGLFRGNQIAAALPGNPPPPFQREQFGGRLGGPLIKDKVFWFMDAERSKQDLVAAEPFTAPFDTLNSTLGEPFREVETDGRLDWTIRSSARAFYRFNFDQNSDIRPYGSYSSLQGFKNRDHAPSNTVGLDLNSGSFTHSFRFEYLKFMNLMADGTAAMSGLENPVPGLGISIGAPVEGNCVISGGGSYCAGPNLLVPQVTVQSNHEMKYDGSKIKGSHIIRYGAIWNHIQGGGYAAFFTLPQVGTSAAGASADPTSYPIQYANLGNGIGFPTSEKAFGYPAGGYGPDNRVEWYIGDTWKMRRNLTVSGGLRYVRDTGRVDSNLGPLTALNDWAPGLGNRVRTPNDNFAPTVSVAWDLKGNGKTVIRAGGGLFYENAIWNNVIFDSPARIPTGIFSYTPLVCSSSGATGFTWPVNISAGTSVAGGAGIAGPGNTVTPTFCGETIGTGGPAVIALSNALKAAAAGAGSVPNPNYIGSTFAAPNAYGLDVFDPNYRSGRSWQMNVGIEHELHPGTIISADFVRNIGEHYLIAIDQNHSGAARSFNLANAQAARDAAQTANGCAPGAGQAGCMITALGQAGAQAAYSGAGLDSDIAVTGGYPCPTCAFPGTNPVSGNSGTVGSLAMLEPLGRSVYDGLQVKLVQKASHPLRGVKNANFQVSYSLSRFDSMVQDQDFINLATNNDNPLQFMGPNAMDRTHQLSFGGTFNLPWYTQFSLIGHFLSPLPQNIQLPELTSGGEIFATDWLGSGLGSGAAPEPVPGTQIGQFMRGTDAGNLQGLIDTYNKNYAGSLTPAGKQMVSSNVMTASDMALMGWDMPSLSNVAPGALNLPWLRSFDAELAWPIPILKERLKITPSVSIFNLFNMTNAFLPGNLPLASLLPGGNGNLASNVVGGVTQGGILPYRATFQSGTNALGAPRQVEFGLKLDF